MFPDDVYIRRLVRVILSAAILYGAYILWQQHNIFFCCCILALLLGL